MYNQLFYRFLGKGFSQLRVRMIILALLILLPVLLSAEVNVVFLVYGGLVAFFAVWYGINRLLVGPIDLRARGAELEAMNCRLQAEICAYTQRETENQRLYQEAIQARDEFLSIAAHELKTPVTGLRGFTQVLLRQVEKHGAPDPAKLRKSLQTIDQKAAKLVSLVSLLLDLTRLEGRRLQLDCRPTNLCQLVREVVSGLHQRTLQHTLTVCAPESLVLAVDPLRMEQVFANLLDNAIKYSPEGGPVEIDISTGDASTAQITISDRGIGIPAAQRSHIFDRFYQAHGNGYQGGMGLGLYISRQIVELHGGKIEAESPAEGGTRFIITLPFREEKRC